MYKTCPRVLPANRDAVITYLRHETIFQIDKLLQSTHDPPPNAYKSMELLRLTQEFIAIREQRLQDNLEAVLYDIDAENTVSLLTGPGRIERVSKLFRFINLANQFQQYIYPMLYLLLRRHYGVLELATTVILHPKEIYDMTASLWNLFAVVDRRLENLACMFAIAAARESADNVILSAIFEQSNVDVEEKLKNFAFGMVGLIVSLDWIIKSDATVPCSSGFTMIAPERTYPVTALLSTSTNSQSSLDMLNRLKSASTIWCTILRVFPVEPHAALPAPLPLLVLLKTRYKDSGLVTSMMHVDRGSA